jgi:hypothetical protein
MGSNPLTCAAFTRRMTTKRASDEVYTYSYDLEIISLLLLFIEIGGRSPNGYAITRVHYAKHLTEPRGPSVRSSLKVTIGDS